MKNKTKMLALLLSVVMCGVIPHTAMAADEIVYEEVGGTGTKNVAVEFDVDTFTVKLPKSISGKSSTVSYEVGVKGSIPDGSTVSIVPNEQFTLTSEEGYTATAEVSQEKLVWMDTEISADAYSTASGTIKSNVASGKYDGTLQFEISLKLPGLYGTDGTFTSWDTLRSNGLIGAGDDGVMTACSTNLTGELRLHNSVTTLKNRVFSGTTLSKIYIPETISSIDTGTFTAPTSLVLEYCGIEYGYGDGYLELKQQVFPEKGVNLGNNWWDWVS